jgi:hypothetical protein
MQMLYENTFHTETNVAGTFTSRVNANVSIVSIGGFSLQTNVINYIYNTENGLQLEPGSTSVVRTLTTGNNFTMRAFGTTVHPTTLFLGTDSTTLTTIADNGLIRAQQVNAVLLNAASLVSNLINVADESNATFVRLHTNGLLTSTGMVRANQVVVEAQLNVPTVSSTVMVNVSGQEDTFSTLFANGVASTTQRV